MEFKTEMGTYIRVQKRSNMTWEEHNNMCRELINVVLNHEDIIRNNQVRALTFKEA